MSLLTPTQLRPATSHPSAALPDAGPCALPDCLYNAEFALHIRETADDGPTASPRDYDVLSCAGCATGARPGLTVSKTVDGIHRTTRLLGVDPIHLLP